MSDLAQQFQAAVAASKTLPEKPDNATLLQLYALYKQATSGDVQDERPGLGDFVGRAKWDAWKSLAGQSSPASMQAYIDLIQDLS